jgi:hypothetical protein
MPAPMYTKTLVSIASAAPDKCVNLIYGIGTMSPLLLATFTTALSRSSNSLLICPPQRLIIAPISRAYICLDLRLSERHPLRCGEQGPSMAVLPTPGSPTSISCFSACIICRMRRILHLKSITGPACRRLLAHSGSSITLFKLDYVSSAL